MGVGRILAPKHFLLASCLFIATLTETSAVDEGWGLTKFDVKHVNHNWTINNYSHNDLDYQEVLGSPLFWGDDSKEYKWQLQLYPKGHKDDAKTYIAVYLALVNRKDVTADVKITIINNLGQKVLPQTFKHKYTRPRESHGFKNFILQYYVDTAYKTIYAPDDKVTIAVDIAFSIGQIRVSNQCSSINPKPCTSLPYAQDFMSDVDMNVEDQYLKAHKAALIAHSRWFESELNLYPVTNSVWLPSNVKADVMKEALRFIYTGKIDESNEDMLEKLLELSNTLSMDKLKLHVEQKLCESMTPRTANTILKMAKNLNAENLKREAENYLIALDEKVAN